MRFHSLPGSKRYPETAAEYGIVLDRYNTVLDELFSEKEIHLLTCDWSNRPEPPARTDSRWNSEARYWTSVRTDPTETDPEFISYTHLFVQRLVWHRGAIDALLHAVTDDATAGVMIADLSLERIYHPYDGGADVLLPTGAERDALVRRHPDWLSQHPNGF
nr:hypothetical protein [Nocardia jejuensis]